MRGARFFNWGLIIQEFPLPTTSAEQQESIALYSFVFIPLESVRSLKSQIDYDWNAQVVSSLAPSSKVEAKYRTNITSQINQWYSFTNKTNLFVISIMHCNAKINVWISLFISVKV